MLRGEVWWVDFPPPIGRRPAVLISRNAAYSRRTSVTAIPVTTTVRNIRSYVALGQEDGMPRACAASADDITTVPVGSIMNRITALTDEKVRALEDAVRFALAMG